MRVFVGNLHFSVTDADLRAPFERYGKVTDPPLVTRDGMSRGIAFVTMPDLAEARNAISKLDQVVVSGRNIQVNEAKR
jgi:RNA recognition motif-containing protein